MPHFQYILISGKSWYIGIMMAVLHKGLVFHGLVFFTSVKSGRSFLTV